MARGGYEAKEAKQEIDIAYENELYSLFSFHHLCRRIFHGNLLALRFFYAFHTHFQFFPTPVVDEHPGLP